MIWVFWNFFLSNCYRFNEAEISVGTSNIIHATIIRLLIPKWRKLYCRIILIVITNLAQDELWFLQKYFHKLTKILLHWYLGWNFIKNRKHVFCLSPYILVFVEREKGMNKLCKNVDEKLSENEWITKAQVRLF